MIITVTRLPVWLLVLLTLTFLVILFAAALLIFEQGNSQSVINSLQKSLWLCTNHFLFGKSELMMPASEYGRMTVWILLALNRLLYVFIVAYAIVHFRKRRSVSQ